MKGKSISLTDNRGVAGMTKLRHSLIILLICLGLFVLPTSSNSNGETMRDLIGFHPTPIKEKIIFWEPLPDRTLLVDYGNVKYRYNILDVEQSKKCAEVTYNPEGTYSFMTHIGGHAVAYLVSEIPEFIRFPEGEDWIWLGRNQ